MAKYQRGDTLQNQKTKGVDVIVLVEPVANRLAYGPQGWETFYEVRQFGTDNDHIKYMMPQSVLENDDLYKLERILPPSVVCSDCCGRGGRWVGDPCHGSDRWLECKACEGSGAGKQ